MNRKSLSVVLTLVFLFTGMLVLPSNSVKADGYINFENGVDGEVIRSTIPGLEFTNTAGFDWVYADVRTGKYNAPYPDCPYGHPDPDFCGYTLNGYFAAWLGQDQGDGKITFTMGGATYLSVWFSAGEIVYLEGYDAEHNLVDRVRVDPNINTGRLTQARVKAPEGETLSYAMVRGVGNYWVMDDLSTDAEGVPDTRKTPIVFVHGIMGSELLNHGNEVWPNEARLVVDPWDRFLLVTKLDDYGIEPADPSNDITVGDIIRKFGYGDLAYDFYDGTVEGFHDVGYDENVDLFICAYDWRKDIRTSVDGLDDKITEVLTQINGGETDPTKWTMRQVNIVAHSMGGLVSRYYITDPDRASRVNKLVILGTPFAGAPRAFKLLWAGDAYVPVLNSDTAYEIVQNFPSAYELVPSVTWYDYYVCTLTDLE